MGVSRFGTTDGKSVSGNDTPSGSPPWPSGKSVAPLWRDHRASALKILIESLETTPNARVLFADFCALELADVVLALLRPLPDVDLIDFSDIVSAQLQRFKDCFKKS